MMSRPGEEDHDRAYRERDELALVERGRKEERERIERLIMGHDPIPPEDRAYLVELINRR